MVYLAGPGRHEEHRDPHVVAGSPAVELGVAGGQLDRSGALRLARWLDEPARAMQARAQRGVYARAQCGRDHGGQRVMEREKVGEADAHVYQVALSARAEEGELGDQVWAQVAHEFVDRMGIAARGNSSAVTTRWAAIHHGQSSAGNDHIHLVVNLAREDGSTVDVHNDFRRARQVCRDLEVEFGLMPLHPNPYELARTYARAEWDQGRRTELAGTDPGSARVPWAELDTADQHEVMAAECGSQGEWAAALASRDRHADPQTVAAHTQQGAREALGRARARAGWQQRVEAGTETRPWSSLTQAERAQATAHATPIEDPKTTLGRAVRAASTAAVDEAEFVRRLRQAGLLTRPRYATGHTDIVEGYSVAQRPQVGERPIWRGGGRLGRDLTLPRLRQGWADTPQAAADAAAEWNAAHRGQRVTTTGRESCQPEQGAWRECDENLDALLERLRAVPVTDHDTWATVARQASGALAAYSNATEAVPGDLAAASEALARSARTYTPSRRPAQAGTTAIADMAMLLASVSAGGRGNVMQAVMVRQLLGLAQAIYEASAAAADARQAKLIATDTRTRLLRVYERLPQPVPAPDSDPTDAASVDIITDERAREAHELAQLGHGTPISEATRRAAHNTAPQARPNVGHGTGTEHGTER